MVLDPPSGEGAPSQAENNQGDEAGRAVDNGLAGIVGDGSQCGHELSIAKI